MGDNRSISDDSRDHEGDPGGGTIPENAVIGRAFVIIWPVSRWRILPIPATFEQPALNSSSAAAAGTTRRPRPRPDLLSARLEPSSPALPLSLGFAGPSRQLAAAPGPARAARRRRRPRPKARRAVSPGARGVGRVTVPTAAPRELRTLRSVMTRDCDPGALPRQRPPPRQPRSPPARYPRYPGYTPRRDGGLAAYETVLARAGFTPVAGIDEAGRGACAGPLVVAAVVLEPASIKRMPGLADSKLLSPQAREDAYAEVLRRAVDWHVVVIGSTRSTRGPARLQRLGHAPRVRRAALPSRVTC
jgi:hypothetical protein